MPYAHRSSNSTCVDDYSGHHRELPEQRREQREGVLSNFLKKALPAPLHQPIRRAVLFVMVPLRRHLRRTWRSGLKRRVRGRRNRLKRRVRDTRNRVRRKLQRSLRKVWGRQLKQRLWPAMWRIHVWRRGSQPLEANNQIHLISSLWKLHTGTSLRTLHLFEELEKHADVHLW